MLSQPGLFSHFSVGQTGPDPRGSQFLAELLRGSPGTGSPLVSGSGRGALVFMARNAFDLEYTGEHNRGITFTDVKDIHKSKPAT